MDINILPLDEKDMKPVPAEISFGSDFSNRMFQQKYHIDRGWHDAEIRPYGPIELDPATAVLHYAQEIFEGTKAYRRPDGNVNLFRPLENMKRFNRSAERMAMPSIPEQDHLDAIAKLVELEEAWVPNDEGSSLYIRPFMFASRPSLGVYPSEEYLHLVIVGPVGAYFKEGFNPVPVYISDEYRRAVRGGVGAAKTGGNYASSLMVGREAAEKGYSQVLWLDAIEGRYVEEVGAMNICVVYEGNHIVTPSLSGSILPGITRDSVLQLGKDLGYQTSEAAIDVNEMLADIESGKITEVFGCGTAAVIAPVSQFGYEGKDYVINNGVAGPIGKHLYDELTGIQYGQIEDRFGWTQEIKVASASAV